MEKTKLILTDEYLEVLIRNMFFNKIKRKEFIKTLIDHKNAILNEKLN